MGSAEEVRSSVFGMLRCPRCLCCLDRVGEEMRCVSDDCRGHFPIVNGVPVLLNEEESVFSIADYVPGRVTAVGPGQTSRLSALVRKCIPNISRRIKSGENFEKFASRLLDRSSSPRVLIIGGRVIGEGIKSLIDHPSIELVETDVAFGPRTTVICDAHSLPFESGSLDGVVAQAVLEHVMDPYQCVEEIYRVLKKKGLVYAETPFMIPGHLERYDFTRFTLLGHRRLFRRFDEIDSGAVCGPGMALAWLYRSFLTSFTTSEILRKLIFAFAAFTSFFLKYFDSFLIDKPGTIDAAAVNYFLGEKGDIVLSDRELLKQYRGGQLR
jgi:SAM-dependent methyltransferase